MQSCLDQVVLYLSEEKLVNINFVHVNVILS